VKLKKIGIVLLVLALVAIIAALVVDDIVEGKVEKMLQKEFGRELSYKSLDSNVLLGEFEITSVSFDNGKFLVETDEFHISGFDYYDYFFNDKIAIDEIRLLSPKITILKQSDSLPRKKTQGKRNLQKDISINDFTIKNGSLLYLEKQDTLLSVESFDFEWGPIAIGDGLPKPSPFNSGSYSLTATNLNYDLVKHHGFGAKKIRLSNEAFLFSGIWLKPNYSRAEFRKIIPYEKDMYDLKIANLRVEKPMLRGMPETPVFKSPKMAFSGVNFEIYRDKTVRDDLREKKMYSEVLRDLELELDVKKIKIDHTHIKYQERIFKDRDLGTVEFFGLSAEIQNVTNIGMASENFPKTKIDIRTDFMNTSNLRVEWEFDISNKMDEFTMSGRSTKIPPEAMNPFFIPAMNIKSKGSIDELYFNIHGDKDDALSNLKLVYDDFAVDVLEKDGQGKKEFVSLFANLLLKGKSKNGSGTVQNVHVVRDKTKSFWNFFWKCIYGGLRKAML
jgi:hypothetical protein